MIARKLASATRSSLTAFHHTKRGLRTQISYAEGPSEPPLSTKTLPQFWRTEILEKHSARLGLIARKERPRAHGGPPSRNLGVSTHLAWDFEEFNRHIDALALGLLSLGVNKGDRVAVIMGNTRSV